MSSSNSRAVFPRCDSSTERKAAIPSIESTPGLPFESISTVQPCKSIQEKFELNSAAPDVDFSERGTLCILINMACAQKTQTRSRRQYHQARVHAHKINKQTIRRSDIPRIRHSTCYVSNYSSSRTARPIFHRRGSRFTFSICRLHNLN